MPEPSVAYFPLRSNAASIVAGQQIALLRRRIKRAALLHDKVILEAGAYLLRAGPRASVELWTPPTGKERWQTPYLRAKAGGGHFWLAAKLTDSDPGEPARTLVDSPTTLAWIATLEPLRHELSRSYDWLVYAHVDDDPSARAEAKSVSNPDRRDEGLARLWPEPFVRDAIVTSVNLDLAVALGLGAAVFFDRTHAPVVEARVKRGAAQPALGHFALAMVMTAEPTWEEVDELRRTRGLRDYRAVLREIEAAARERATGGSPDARVLRYFSDRLEAASAKRPSGRAKVLVALTSSIAGFGAGMALAGMPGAGEAVSLVVGLALDRAIDQRAQPRWLAIHRRVRGLGPPSSRSLGAGKRDRPRSRRA